MINPKLNIQQLRKSYLKEKRVRIEQFLSPEIALGLQDVLRVESLPMHLAFFLEGKALTIPSSEFYSENFERKGAILKGLRELATQGIGYCYESMMPSKVSNGQVTLSGQGFDRIRGLSETLASPGLIKLITQISGNRAINASDSQLTRFREGHFITRHRDELLTKRRELAYVLSLTDGWHPDWGGLLQFFNSDGSIRDAWTPKFNTLSLFDIKHIHSVTYVTPFARVPRYSMTGWFMS